jgi:hypothetical protein
MKLEKYFVKPTDFMESIEKKDENNIESDSGN